MIMQSWICTQVTPSGARTRSTNPSGSIKACGSTLGLTPGAPGQFWALRASVGVCRPRCFSSCCWYSPAGRTRRPAREAMSEAPPNHESWSSIPSRPDARW
jgi:hypothetical protein